MDLAAGHLCLLAGCAGLLGLCPRWRQRALFFFQQKKNPDADDQKKQHAISRRTDTDTDIDGRTQRKIGEIYMAQEHVVVEGTHKDLVKIKVALLSVSDKTDVVPFAHVLASHGVELVRLSKC